MISIVIPCFNEELIVNDFIDELKNNIDQIKDEFEIIFVDNKSEDSTLDIINKKKQIFKRKIKNIFHNFFYKCSFCVFSLRINNVITFIPIFD